MNGRHFFLMALLGWNMAGGLALAQTPEILGRQPVLILALSAEGRVVDLQLRQVQAREADSPVDFSRGIDIIQSDPAFRPEQEHIELKAGAASSGQELELKHGDTKLGIAKRVLLIPRPASESQALSAYVAYAPSSGVGYIQAVDETWTVRSQTGEVEYVVVAYKGTLDMRHYEVIQGAGVHRALLPVARGENPAVVAARNGKRLVVAEDAAVRSSEVVEIVAFNGLTTSQIQGIRRMSALTPLTLSCGQLFR